MLKSERENSRVFFVFSTEVADIEELKTGWFNSTAKIPAMTFANNIKSLKSVCHMT